MGMFISGSATSTASFATLVIPSEDGATENAIRFYPRFYIRASDLNPSVTGGYSSRDGNTIIGFEAGNQHVTNQAQTGHSNTLLGHYAGTSLTSGDHNTFLGHAAGLGGTVTGDDNTAVGSYAGYNLVNGADNILIGQSSGFNMRSGSNNVAIGDNAFASSRGSTQNTII